MGQYFDPCPPVRSQRTMGHLSKCPAGSVRLVFLFREVMETPPSRLTSVHVELAVLPREAAAKQGPDLLSEDATPGIKQG